MKCPHCFSNVTESMKNCPSCGQNLTPQPVEPTPVVTEKQTNSKKDLMIGLMKVAAVFLCFFLVFAIGKSIINNRGGYEFSGYGMSDYYEITYHGRLSKLVSKDYDVLEDFIYRQKVSGKEVHQVVCNDYTLTYCNPGDLGTVDVTEDNVTVYQKGLIKYTVKDKSDKCFFSDFIFCIEDTKSGHAYYFYSLSDVEDWIAKRT